MTTALLVTLACLVLVAVVLQIVLVRRGGGGDLSAIRLRFDSLERSQERTELSLREEIARGREEASTGARQQREEMTSALKGASDSLLRGLTDMTASNEAKLEALRSAVDLKLRQIQEDSSSQLDRMRQTVDEKLQGTLERRLGESFRQVSDRLEQVYRGLGEMQALATGVGDLKRVLTNVKVRGGWGEIQLGTLLEQVLTPEQYERNVRTGETGREAVEFAIKLPGRSEEEEEPVWLPVDAKFPLEDYQRLVEAQERADPEAAEAAGRMLAGRIRTFAKDMHDKYVNPPKTTDFAIMFLPTEGLYAEALRRAGLAETIQRDYRVVIAGPTTFAALLNSLQMGFRTLAIQKRSSEVWALLGAVKAEFGKYGDVIAGVKRSLDQAASKMDDVAVRSRAIQRKLRKVEELPTGESQALLADDTLASDSADDEE